MQAAQQCGQLDALISGLFGLTAALQQMQQQAPPGMLNSHVESGMQSYGSSGNTWFYNSL
jgi:hypothetical protein